MAQDGADEASVSGGDADPCELRSQEEATDGCPTLHDLGDGVDEADEAERNDEELDAGRLCEDGRHRSTVLQLAEISKASPLSRSEVVRFELGMMRTRGDARAMVSPHPFRIYAHRGASAELPENTLAAFERALELGCDALETDVHLSRDGQVVVHHDATARRLSRDDRRIVDLDLDEVRKLDVGRGLHPPTLDEVLETFPGVHVNIDIKAHSREAAEAVVQKVLARGDERRVLLTSVDDAVVRWVRATGYPGDVGIGKLGALMVLATPSLVSRAVAKAGWVGRQALQIPWRFKGVRFDRERVVRRARAAGLRVDYWTINDPELAKRIVRIGADGIMTDDPRRVVEAVSEARGR